MKYSMIRMNRYQKQILAQDDEIDLTEIFSLLVKGKWVILAFTLSCALAAFVFGANRPIFYQAEVLLFDSDNQSSADLLGLQNLMGFSLSSEKNVNAKIAIEMMNSKSFVANFIRKYKLSIPIAAAIGWNRESNQLILDSNVYDTDENLWIRKNFSSTSSSMEPTDLELHRKFVNNFFSIKQNQNSYFYTVSIKHFSPFIAKEILDNLVAEINLRMRDRAIGEAERNLNYLQTQLSKTSVAEMQISLYSLITEQTKTLMLAEAKEYYAFEVLDPPMLPEEPIASRLLLTTVLGSAVGLFFGTLFSFILFYFKGETA